MENEKDHVLDRLIVVGDRLLIKPKTEQSRTKSGLYLPPGYKEKEEVRSGYVVKVGPGYPIPFPAEEEEAWKKREEQIKYIPLQAREGDLAIFIQKGAVEIVFNGEKYFIVPQHSILLLERDEELFK
ncbi:MAG: co-chaperone GroES family protein [Bacteroidales bacterium]|nr:co-chaperone GroES family protein [Bacteroidales bacterium]MCF8351420.1 co-chaperone GroES family protein [Bacteroidales bacterium]MCF8377217.1 co-chaperone GroES family protein [Bacteroidales bacterium]MCF8401088.1 co-chaperone GroES family protein [Bacteroidales bacterium]